MIFVIAAFVCIGIGLIFWIGMKLFAKSVNDDDDFYFGDL